MNSTRQLLFLFSLVALVSWAEPLRMSVAAPENKAGLTEDEVETIWLSLEAEAKEAAEQARLLVVRRGVAPRLRKEGMPVVQALGRDGVAVETSEAAQAQRKTAGEGKDGGSPRKLEADLTMLSSLGKFLGKYLLALEIWDNAKCASLPGSAFKMDFPSMQDLMEQLPFMVKTSMGAFSSKCLAAVLFPTVSFSQCPKNLPQSYHEMLQQAFLKTGLRVAAMDDIRSIFEKNNLDPLQTLPPRLYPKVAKQLNVQYLVQTQIMNCSLSLTSYQAGLQRPGGKLLTGVFHGTIKVIGMDGTIRSIHPCDMVFDFNRLISTGGLNITGWGYDQYYQYMASASLGKVLPELLAELVK